MPVAGEAWRVTWLGGAALAVLLLAGAAAAAVALAPPPPAPVALPVTYGAGGDAVPPHVPSFSLAPDGSSFHATLRGVQGATLVMGDLATLTNVDEHARDVTLAAAPVTDPGVLAHRIDWMDGARVAGTLDLKADAPGVTLQLAPGATLRARVTLALAEDAAGSSTAAVTTLVGPAKP